MPIINRDTDYAIRALARLGRAGEVKPVSELADAERAPVDFLKKIMQKLHRASIVASQQGPFGGYALSRLPGEITLLEIVEAVQGPIAVNLCFCNLSTCNRTTCSLKRHLTSLQAKVNEWLEGVTLGDIIEDLSQVKGGGFHGQAAASLKTTSSKSRWPVRKRSNQPLRKA